MAAEIKVPVRLEVLQESISQIRSTLANLKPESSGWKELSNILRTMEKEALNLQATMSKPFGTQAQFSNAEKSVDKLDDALERARITMGRIKFSDLKLNPAETAELKKLQQELKDIENEVTKFKADIKQNLQLSDIWDSLVELDPNAVTHSFDEIVKTVQNRVSKLQAEAKKAKEAFNDSQAGARKGELTQKLLGDGAKNVLTNKLDKDIFNQYFQNTKNGLAFKSNQKGPFYDWVKANLTLSDAQYQEINNLSAKALQEQLSKMDFSKNLSEATKAQDTNRAAQGNMTAKNAEFEQAKAVLAALGIEIDKVNDKQASMGARTAEVSGKVQSFQEHLTNGRRALLDTSGASDQMRSALNSLRTALDQADAQFLKLQRTTQTFNQMKMAIVNFMGFNQVLNLTKRAVKEALSHIKELDTVMNRISIVTDMSTGDLWNQVDAYSKMAQTYGVSIKGAYEVSQIYYQQGLKTNDVLILTNETLKLSKISGLDYAQTTDYMTTAIRGFKMEMSEASKVVDVYSALAAHTAVSSEELAVAMSKTASSMESVGSTFEETSAMIGTMVAVTRESATNIGSALKSIAARYGEMKKDPMTLIDGDGEAIAFNKVDAALQSVGISMKTADGQFREFTDVIIELSEKWNTLESTQQRYIATQFAGNRQQSRFLALVSNADLLKANIETAENSEDTGTLQALKALDSIESKIEQVRVAYQQFYTTVGAENAWKGALDGLKNYINYLNSLPKLFGKFPLSALAVASNVIGILKMLGEHLIGTIAQAWEKGLTKSQQEAQKTNAGEEIINQLNEKNEAIRNAGREAGRVMGQGFSEGVAEGANQTTTTLMNKAAEASAAIGSSTAQQQQAGKVPTTSQTQKDIATKDTATANVSNWFSSAIKDVDLSADTTTIVASMTTMAAEASNTLKPEMEAVGRDGGISIVQGLLESTGMTAEAARTLAITIIDTMRSALNMHSPSPTIIAMFENGVGEAIALGLEASYDEVATAAQKLGLSVSDNLKQAFENSSKINLSDHFEKGDAQKLIQQVAKDKSVELSQVALPSNKIVSGKDSKLVLREDGLTEEQYQAFQSRYKENKKQYQTAIKPIHDRQEEVSSEIQALEQEAESLRQEAIRKAYANNDKSRAEHYESEMRDFNALLPGEKYDRLYDLKNEKASLSQQEQTIRKRTQLEHNKIETEENATKQANQKLLIQEKAEAEARERAQQEKEEEEARKAKEDAERKAREEAENTRKIEEANQRSAERLAKERTLPEAYIPKNHARVEPRDREAFVGEVAPNRSNTTVTASLDELRAATREARQVTPIDLEDAKANGQEAGTVIKEEIEKALDDKVPGPEIETDKTEEAAKETAELITKVADTAQDNKDETIDSPINPDQVKSDVDATMTELQKLEAEYDKLKGQGASAALRANFEGETAEYDYTQTLRSALGQKTFNQSQTTQNQQDTQSSIQDTNAQVTEAEQLAQAKAQEAAEVEQLRQKYLQLIETKKQSSDITDEKAKELAQQAQEIQNVEELKKKTEELNQTKKETTKGQEETSPVSSDTPGIIDRAKAGLSSLHDTIQNNSKAFGNWSRAIGMGLSSITSFIDTTTQGGEAAKNAIVGIGGAISMVGAIISHAGPIAIISAAITAITGAIAFIKSFSLDAQIERAEKQAEELTNKAKQAKAEYKSLDNGIKKLDELNEKRYESAEAAEEYQTQVDELAEKFPQMIAGFDAAGNVILDTTSAEKVLAEARQNSAKATYDAAKQELKAADLKRQQAFSTIQSLSLETVGTSYTSDDIQSFMDELKDATNNNVDIVSTAAQRMQYANNAEEKIEILAETVNHLFNNRKAFSGTDEEYEAFKSNYRFLIGGYKDHQFSFENMSNWLNDRQSEGTELSDAAKSFRDTFLDDTKTNLIDTYNQAINEYNTIIKDETSSNKERLTAYNKAYQAFQAAIEGNAIAPEDIENFQTAFEAVDTELSNYETLNNVYKGYQREVISAWQRSADGNQKAWDYLSKSSNAAAIVTKQIQNTVQDDDWETASQDADLTKQWQNYQTAAASFLRTLSDDRLDLFNQMTSDTSNFTADDIIKEFNLNPNYGFGKAIVDYYTEGVHDISERLNASLSKALGNKQQQDGSYQTITKENVGNNQFYQQFLELSQKQLNVVNERYLNSVLEQYQQLNKAGYSDKAESFASGALSLFTEIEKLPSNIQKTIWASVEENGIVTKEGLEKILLTFKNNKDNYTESEWNDVMSSFDELNNSILHNISLMTETAVDSFLNSWEDTSKTLSSAISGGVSIKDADSIIEQAKNLDFGNEESISLEDFQLIGDKLVLTAQAYDRYYRATIKSMNDRAEEIKTELSKAQDINANDFIKSEFDIDNKKYTFRLSNNYNEYKEILDSIGISEEQLKKVLEQEGPEAVQKLIDDAVVNLNERKDYYTKLIAIAQDQLMNSENRKRGIYKINGEQQTREQLEKITKFDAKLSADDIEGRAIKESINSVYSTLLSDVVSKGLENINLADYEGLIQSDARRLAHLKETSNAEYIIREYAVLAGKSLEEVDELLAQNTQRTTSRYSQAIKEVLNYDSDGYISEVTKSLGVSHAELKNNSEQAIIKAKAFLDELAKQIGKAGYSLEEYNSEAKSILDKTLFNQGGNARALLDFASGDIGADALESLANSFGLQLDQLVDVTTGVIQGNIGEYLNYNKTTGNYDIQGTFNDFINALEQQFGIKIDRTSKTYIEALKSWNDASIEKEHEIDKAITEELKAITSAKPGEKVNLAQTYSTLYSKLVDREFDDIAHQFYDLGATLTRDGILSIRDGANIPAIIEKLAQEAAKAGQLIPEELAELNDALVQVLRDITNIISSGIGGSISNEEKRTLTDWAKNYNITNLQFIETADGYQLASESAKELYNTINNINSLQGQVVFEALKDNLIESDERFRSISANTAYIRDLETQGLNTEQHKILGSLNGNVDLFNRPVLQNADGSITTLFSSTEDSRNYESEIPWVMNITPVTPAGKELSDAELQQYIQKLVEESSGNMDEMIKLDKGQLGLIIEGENTEIEQQEEILKAYDERAEKLHDISNAIEENKQKSAEELALAQKMAEARGLSQDDSFKFMEQAIPDAQNNPLNYWENWGKAYQAMNEAGKTGKMDYSSFYNLVTEMGNLESITGKSIQIGKNVKVNAENVASLIEQAAGALQVQADGSIKIDLSKIGVDFVSGADEMNANIEDGIHQVAQSQIDMLDSLIGLLETIVTMEDAFKQFNVDSDMDMKLDLDEIFDVELDDNGNLIGEITGFADKWQNALEYLRDRLDPTKLDTYSEDFARGAESIKFAINNTQMSLANLIKADFDDLSQYGFTPENLNIYQKIMQGVYDAIQSGDFTEKNVKELIMQKLQNNLGDSGEIVFDMGNYTFIGSGGMQFSIDWDDNATAEAMKHLNADIEKEKYKLTEAYQARGKGEASETEFEATLIADGVIQVVNGQMQIVIKNGPDADTYTPNSDQWKNAIGAGILQDMGADNIEFVTNLDGITAKGTIKSGIKEFDVESGDNGKTHFKSKTVSGEFNSIQEVVDAEVKDQLDKESRAAGEQQQPFDYEGRKIELQFQAEVEAGISHYELNSSSYQNLSNDVKNELEAALKSGNKVQLDSVIDSHIELSSLKGLSSSEILEKLGLKELKIKLEGDTEAATIAIEGLKTTVEELTKEPIKLKVESDPSVSKAATTLQTLKNKLDAIDKADPIISITTDPLTAAAEKLVSSIANTLRSLTSRSIEVHTVYTQEGTPPKLPPSGKFTVNGAHSLLDATGNVGLARAQGTLMGELGPELVVSNGRYFVAGQQGAEFVDLDTDAIVFNHLQTEQLLKHGMSKQRGQAITNERNAVAFAQGNMNGGPALASAKAVLGQLKQLRAMWQSLLGASAKDLAGMGGSGGGGGGDKDNDPKAFVKELEIWYNWLQRIAVLEEKITMEEAKRSKFQSDFIRSGENYAKSNLDTLKYLREQAVINQSLVDSQQKYFDQRRAQMNAASNPFSALYTFDEYGQLRYKNAGFQNLSKLSGRDSLTGQGNLSAADQYATLVSMGFEKYMQYDSSGNKIDTSGEDWEVTAVQAFWDKVDSDKEEMQSLHDSIEEHKKAVVENQQKANEIMHEIEDNQMSVEDKILKAIESTRQREIDELQKERDAIEEASQNLIDGLSKQLEKERDMYSQQETQNELAQLQRRAAILRSSGGSQGDIASLYNDITQKQQDMYFDAQQRQIDALQEATDAQLEKLDAQLDLMNETLAYEKENGLLWNEVYNVMNLSAEEIADFITRYDSDYWGQSATRTAADYREALFEADQFKTYQSQMESGLSAIVNSFTDYAIKQDAKIEQAKQDAITAANANINIVRGEIKAASNGGGSGGGGAPTASTPSSGAASPSNTRKFTARARVPYRTKTGQAGEQPGEGTSTISLDDARSKAAANAYAAITRLGYYPTNSPQFFKEGGLVTKPTNAVIGETGKPEAVLNPQQTHILREEILSNKPNSLLRLLTDFKNAYGQSINGSNIINNASGVTIEQAIVEMHVSQIANDYDAQRAGEQALDKIIQIARKSQGQNRVGR